MTIRENGIWLNDDSRKRNSVKRRGGGQNFERPNVERPIFRKFETFHIDIMKVEFYELSNFKNLLIFETQQFQKFDFLLSLSIMEI